MPASAWEWSVSWPGCAAWSISAKPSPSRACCTAPGREIPMKQSHIAIIGAPMDLGAGRRGVDMGPSALRLAGLNEKIASLGYEVKDLGNIMVDQVMEDRYAPLVLGGDHSVAMGTVAGVSRYFHKTQEKIGLIWIDAHAD